MGNLVESLPVQGNVLFVSNGCGGGHIQAVNSLQAQVLEKRPGLNCITIDAYKSSFGGYIGDRVISTWARQQKEGNVAGLNNYLNYRWVERYVLSVITFFSLVGVLLRNDIDVVIDAQPYGLGALLSAVHVVNFIRRVFCQKKTPIDVKMVLTELPNAATSNFFPTIKTLWSCDHHRFSLYTAPPLLERADQTEEEFWKTHCGLPMDKVHYDQFPLRRAFFEQSADRPTSLRVREDLPVLKIEERNGSIVVQPKPAQGTRTFPIRADDRVLSIHLGGHACIQATMEYVASRIRSSTLRLNKEYVFVLCGENSGKDSLFSRIHQMISETVIPNGLEIVPLTRQTDEEIAPILARSDVAIIKSGGLTSMEVTQVPPRKILIHSLCPRGVTNEEAMIQQGMPVWEGGNARYLMARNQARVVTAETIGDEIF